MLCVVLSKMFYILFVVISKIVSILREGFIRAPALAGSFPHKTQIS